MLTTLSHSVRHDWRPLYSIPTDRQKESGLETWAAGEERTEEQTGPWKWRAGRGRRLPVDPPIRVLLLLAQDLGQLDCRFEAHFPNGDMRHNMDGDFDPLIPARQSLRVSAFVCLCPALLRYKWQTGIIYLRFTNWYFGVYSWWNDRRTRANN